jgi:hypothetical protein
MGFNNCDNCKMPIIWDKQKRERLNTRRPLNRDGTIHLCGGNGAQQPQAQQQQQTSTPAPTPEPTQDQKIKAAQKERLRQHIEFIKNLQWNTKIQALRAEQDGGHGTAAEILDAMGFEEFREEQRQEGYDDL